jgi:hypothetical protein
VLRHLEKQEISETSIKEIKVTLENSTLEQVKKVNKYKRTRLRTRIKKAKRQLIQLKLSLINESRSM